MDPKTENEIEISEDSVDSTEDTTETGNSNSTEKDSADSTEDTTEPGNSNNDGGSKSSTPKKDESAVSVYVVYCSNRTPAEIRTYLLSLAVKNGVKNPKVGPIRVEFYQGKETNRNISVFSRDVYNVLIKGGHDTKNRDKGLSVNRYKLSARDFPRKFDRDNRKNNDDGIEDLEIFVKLPSVSSDV